MKKGVLATILVIQLVLMTLYLFAFVENQKTKFNLNTQISFISSFRFKVIASNIVYNLDYLDNLNASHNSEKAFINFVNSTFSELHTQSLMNLTYSCVDLYDSSLRMHKVFCK